MEFEPVITWLAAGVIGILAVAALIRTFEVVFDLDHG